MPHTLQEHIKLPELLDKDSLYGLRELVARYPYFHAARILFLKNLFILHDPAFGDELRKAAVFIADRRVLFSLVEKDNYDIKPQPQATASPGKPGADRTETLIARFLGSGRDDEPQPKTRKLTAADAQSDYMAYLLQMDDVIEDDTADHTAALDEGDIPDFPTHPVITPTPSEDAQARIPEGEQTTGANIALEPESSAPSLTPVPAALSSQDDESSETTPSAEVLEASTNTNADLKLHDLSSAAPTQEANENMAGEEDYLTETLANIYIRQGRYEKAIEIIRKLNLNYPKKNRYFADQTRFLQKLIINNKYNKTTNV